RLADSHKEQAGAVCWPRQPCDNSFSHLACTLIRYWFKGSSIVSEIELETRESRSGFVPSKNRTRAQWLTLIAAFLGWMFDGMEMGIFPIVARPALQHMQAAHGILNESFVQDWMGRVTALFLL